MASGYRLFLDDERDPPDGDWVIARSVADAIAIVEKHGFPVLVSFDNDLGHGEPEGRDFAKWLMGRDLSKGGMPADFTWYAHTQNPPARDAINGLLEEYMAFREKIVPKTNIQPFLRVERAQHLPPMGPLPPPPPQAWINDELINLETGKVILSKPVPGVSAEDYIL